MVLTNTITHNANKYATRHISNTTTKKLYRLSLTASAFVLDAKICIAKYTLNKHLLLCTLKD